MPKVLRADDVLSGLSFIPSWHRRAWDRGTKNRPSSLYWTKDVIAAYEEYQKVPEYPYDLKDQWIKKKREEGTNKMKEVAKRKLETDKELRNKIQENSIKRNERTSQIQSKLREMKSEKNEYGILRYSEILADTNCFKNAMSYMNRKSPLPFTDRAWTLLKKKLIKEYNELTEIKRQERIEKEKSLSKDTIIQMRQFDIYQIAKHWVPDPETEKRMDDIAAESAFSSVSNLEVSSDAIHDSTTSTSSSNVPIINNDSSMTNSNITNDTTPIKVEDTTSMPDFVPIKIEDITLISDDDNIKIEDTSMNIDNPDNSDTAPMKIDNLISTSDITSMSDTTSTDLTLMSDNYMNITDIYFPIPDTITYNAGKRIKDWFTKKVKNIITPFMCRYKFRNVDRFFTITRNI
jgi:hypothetical protein